MRSGASPTNCCCLEILLIYIYIHIIELLINWYILWLNYHLYLWEALQKKPSVCDKLESWTIPGRGQQRRSWPSVWWKHCWGHLEIPGIHGIHRTESDRKSVCWFCWALESLILQCQKTRDLGPDLGWTQLDDSWWSMMGRCLRFFQS